MVTPYYQDGEVTLYHGDCREITGWTTADVLVTDPPYGITYRSNRKRSRGRSIAGDNDTALRDSILALWGDRPALVFGRWDVLKPTGTRLRLIWDKGNSVGTGNLQVPWGHSDEEIYVLGPWPAITKGGRQREGGNPQRHASVIRVPAINPKAVDRPDHPTPKPVPLFRSLLAHCPPGAVADPCAGSGPTLLAARLLGRVAVGVELEERYCEIIARRLDQGVLDFTL